MNLLRKFWRWFDGSEADGQREVWFRRPAGLAAAFVALALVMTLVQKVPKWQLQWSGIQYGKASDGQPRDLTAIAGVENEFRKTLVEMLGGTFAILAAYFTWRQVRLTQEGQITDRYTRAIEQLGALAAGGGPNFEVRLGAIFAMERIAIDSPRDHWTIMEVLTAYVRRNAPVPTTQDPREAFGAGPSIDIQTILEVLGRRRRGEARETEWQRLNLTYCDLRNANLRRVHFEGAQLKGSYLQGAVLNWAHVERAAFDDTQLQGASFYEACAQEASFSLADVQETRFNWAHLEAASFQNTQIEGASFYRAHVERAIFVLAHGQNAEQIKQATGWEKATYSRQFAAELGLSKADGQIGDVAAN